MEKSDKPGFWRRLARFLMTTLVVVYSLAGAAAITYGLWIWWTPGAFIFGGCYVIFDAWRLSNVQPSE